MNVLYNIDQFYNEVSKQKESVLSFNEIEIRIKIMYEANRRYSVFSLINANRLYIVRGINLRKSIGYYILEDEYLILNGILEE